MNKFNIKIEDGKAIIGLDTNADGENVLDLSLDMSEAIQEVFSKGEAVEGVKIASFNFEGKKLNLSIDTDKDSEELLNLSIDLGELFDELF